jgi:hypothetical protein
MPKKASVPPRIGPVQRVVAEPITDPAEQAAIDGMRKQAKRKPGRQKPKTNRGEAKGASNAAGK